MYDKDNLKKHDAILQNVFTKEQLRDSFLKMNVTSGQTVLVHSSYKSLGNIENGPQTIIDVLLELIGTQGTLLFPTFNFTSWTGTHYFDINHTPSEMGILTEIARHNLHFKRTKHPIYSFIVAGNKQDDFCNIDSENCYGFGSVFDLIYDNNALMLSLGLSFNNTFSLTHYVESISNACTYRYNKSFSGIYIGEDRVPILKTYSMMVRDILKGVKTDIIPAMQQLVDDKIIFESQINNTLCHFTYANPFSEHLMKIIKNHPEMLHKIRF